MSTSRLTIVLIYFVFRVVRVDYMDQIIAMVENNQSTIYVDFQHILKVRHASLLIV